MAGAGIQLEAGRCNPLLAKSAEFHWLQVASHFVGWQKYKCLFFFCSPVLVILGEKWLICSVAFHGTGCCSWLMVPQAQSLPFALLSQASGYQSAEPGEPDLLGTVLLAPSPWRAAPYPCVVVGCSCPRQHFLVPRTLRSVS